MRSRTRNTSTHTCSESEFDITAKFTMEVIFSAGSMHLPTAGNFFVESRKMLTYFVKLTDSIYFKKLTNFEMEQSLFWEALPIGRCNRICMKGN